MGGCESREKEVDSVPQAAVCQNLGEYAVTYSQLPVNASKDRNSAQVAVLEVQTKIEVLEFASEAVESRVRARIASPPGWITAWMVDKTSVYIKQESSGVALKAVQEGNDSIIASARPLAGALSVKAREGARLGPQELQVLGEYDEEAGPQGKAQKRCYKKRDGDIYLYWCDGRSGAKYSDAWWFSRCTDAKHCLFFSPSRSDEDMNSATPPERGWQAPPPYFFQAPKVTPIKVVLKGPPPPSVMDVAVRIKSCGGGCLDFISDVRDALRQRNKAAAEKKAAAAKKAADDEAAAKKKAAEEAAKKAPEQAAAEKKAAAEDKAAAEKKAAAESAAAKKAAHDEEAAKEKGAEEAAKKAPEQAAAEKKAAAEEKDGIAPTAEESPPEKRMNDDEATA